MSAQSSARSKRRQSALFSSKSLLPLPQISISSIATSTPARGSQRQLPAPLPTPGPSQTHLLGTPARKQDDNTTFFGFSPGTEANETALLAVDYRSIGFEDVGRNEQLEADTFDDTAILEQRAFADRRISNEGDQSLGGLGALIFSNLIAGNQPQEALERLELGKRRDGSTSRRSITLSPAKRNASFTLSTGGEYLVDYETDVRFGDDLQDLFDEAAEYATNKEKIFLDAVLPPVTFGSSPIPRLYPPSSPHVANDYPNRTAQSRQEGILAADSLDHQQYTSSPVQHKFYTNTCERSSPTACAEIRLPGKDEPAYTAQALPPLGSSHGYIDPSPAISSASVHPTVPVSDEPSQAMAEKRLARRQRRGLTASMAVLLSPVAEDRDREKSLSRSRSMLREALEDPYLGDPAKEAGHPSVSHVQDHEDHAPESTHDKDAHFHPQEVVTQIQAASIWKGEPDDECHADQSPFPPTGTDTISPVPLACILAASLPDVGRSANLSPASSIFTRPTASEPHPLITDEGQALAMTSLAKSTVKQQKASGAAGSNLKRTAESVGRQNRAAPRDGPSYLKPTLRRSIQQRETVPLRRSVSLSKAKPAVKGAPVRRTASHTMVDHASRPLQPATGRKAQGSVSDRELVTSTSADTTAPRVAIALSKKNSVDDLFERRQRDGGKASSRAREKGKGKELVEHQKFKRPETNQAALPETSSQEPKDRLDAGLTLPRGFSFAQSRPARKPASEDRTGRGEAALHGERAAGRSAVIRPHAVAMRKARRVSLGSPRRVQDLVMLTCLPRSFLR